MLGQIDCISPSVSRSSNVTFWRYHKIKADSLHTDIANCSFVRCPVYTASALYEQYNSDLKDLLDKRAPKVSPTFTKGFSLKAYGVKITHHIIELAAQIYLCISLVNRDMYKASCYRHLVGQNAHDLRNYGRSLHSSPNPQKSFAIVSGRFFSDKITKMRH